MKSINCSKRKQTPPWLVRHFKRSFETLYASNKRSKSPNYENNIIDISKVPQMIYLPPKELRIPTSITVPKHMSSHINSSFKLSATKSASNGNLNQNYKSRTPEKYFSPLKSDWKTVDAVAKVKRGRSAINLRGKSSPSRERSPNFNDPLTSPETKSNEKRKFSKKYIKRKLAKLFRSTGKLNDVQNQDVTPSSKQKPIGNIEFQPAPELPNDALRNLSFTAAMMAKDTKLIEQTVTAENNVEDHTKQIPSSTLRFWKKPTEEKVKASQRRNQDNLYGSSEVLLRINPSTENTKISSELSLFSEEFNHDVASDFGKLCYPENKSSISVSGYDKAFQRYQNIIRESQILSRKDRTLSVAYDCENDNQTTNLKMRSCQSSGSVNTLTRSVSIVNANNDDLFRTPYLMDAPKSQYTQKMSSSKRGLTPNQIKTTVPSISPPAYDRMLGNNRRSRVKGTSTTPTSSYQPRTNSHSRIKQTENIHQSIPKPPPRSDSLIRSFDLICKNLQTSISEPRGDSFKIFKNQNDYQAWLRNLPYHNPDKISTLLRLRSKVAKRQCLSELLNFEISDYNLNGKKRRHSWPLLKCNNFPPENDSTKRSSSLCRVKNKNKVVTETKMTLESPSLYNYSRLYCLRNSQSSTNDQSLKNMPSYKIEPLVKQRPLMLNTKSSAFSIHNRRSSKHRQKPDDFSNLRMAESCHETESHTLI